MKIRVCIWMVTASLLCLVAAADAAPKQPQKRYNLVEEIEQLARPDLLPLYRTAQIVEQVSSYDTTGLNDDGFSGNYSYLRKEGKNLVLADFKGPGVVNRIWTPTPTADTLAFYFDGERMPRLRICFMDLFSGKVFPFIRPVSGNEVGGYYTYLPIPYAKSLKIVFEGSKIMFHQIQSRDLTGFQVESFRPELVPQARQSLEAACRRWENISPTIEAFRFGANASSEVHEERFTLRPGESKEFFAAHEGGRIVGFEIDGGESFASIHKDVILQAYWDGEQVPAIQAPVADFFGYGYGKAAMRSLMIGSRVGLNYCFLPAPYDRSATLSLNYLQRAEQVQSPIEIVAKVYYNNIQRDPEQEGKLYTVWYRDRKVPDGQYYPFLKQSGKGHFVGVIHWSAARIKGMNGAFEGDDSTHVDGKMRMHGTGSEDFYNGGWYAKLDCWDRGVSLPLHGCLDYSLPMARTGGYRFYTTDKMSFEQEIYVGIEHGPEGNKYPVDYTSVAFYYGDKGPDSAMKPEGELLDVWTPREHVYYPQLMQITLSDGLYAHYYEWHGIYTTDPNGAGSFRVTLDEVPEGRYKVSMRYYTHPQGAEVTLWQRQQQLSKPLNTYAVTRGMVESESLGEMLLTPQTNSLTIHLKSSGSRNMFELDAIIIERID